MAIHDGETNMKDLAPNKDKLDFKNEIYPGWVMGENRKEDGGLLQWDVFANAKLIEPVRTI